MHLSHLGLLVRRQEAGVLVLIARDREGARSTPESLPLQDMTADGLG